MLDAIIGLILLIIFLRIGLSLLLFGIFWLLASTLCFMVTFWLGPVGLALSIVVGFFSALGMFIK